MEFEPAGIIRSLRASEPGITAVDFVRRTVTQMQIADELTGSQAGNEASEKAVGWAALIEECQVPEMLRGLRTELDALRTYDLVGYKHFEDALFLAKALRAMYPAHYADCIRLTTG